MLLLHNMIELGAYERQGGRGEAYDDTRGQSAIHEK